MQKLDLDEEGSDVQAQNEDVIAFLSQVHVAAIAR